MDEANTRSLDSTQENHRPTSAAKAALDTVGIRANWPMGYEECQVIHGLCDEVDRLRLEVMAYQVGDGYEKGYGHGTLNAARYLVRAEKAEAKLERVRGYLARSDISAIGKVNRIRTHLRDES